MTRARVLQEFTRWTGWPNTAATIHQTHWYDTDAMADRIAQLENTIAALREPSEAVKIAVQEAVEREALAPCYYREVEQIVRAAVAAAEKEVSDER